MRPQFSKNLYQFYVKHQCAVWRNLCSGTTLTVCQQVGDVEAVLGTLLHQLNTFCPSGDYLIQTEVGRLATLVAAIKDCTV